MNAKATNPPRTTSGRTFGYARVSTQDQTTENQRLEVKAAGFDVHPRRWFADTVSGKVQASARPEFARMLDRIEEGDTLVVTKLDRLGRDSIDVETTLRRLEEMGVRVVVLQLGTTDLTSTAGRLIRKILGAVADMERDLIVERTQEGLRRAKAEGVALGRRPKTTPEQRAEMARRSAEGASISQLAEEYGIARASVRAAIREAEEAA